MNEKREVKDLAIGDVIQVDGFDNNLTVRSAKKIRKGPDAGKLEVTLATPDGKTEVIALAPEERVKVVGKDAENGKDQSSGKSKGKGKVKAKAEAKPEPEAETPKEGRRQKEAEGGAKKMSAIDAAAKVLVEAGAPMNCRELIQVMAEKDYWNSPGGKTPAATLYSAILREIQTKGKDARFQKTERGKFEAAHSKA